MKIIIECNKVEQQNWLKSAEAVEDYCIFEDNDNVKCSFDNNCKECLLKNIEWHVNDDRACYSCGSSESENNLLNIHTLLYSGKDTLICDKCYHLLRLYVKGVERNFGGDMNEND